MNPGVTLTIEPGAIIKAELGQGWAGAGLWVARGAKLLANGTPELPIIFTSVADNITVEDVENGNVRSPNLNPSIDGLWQGVVILGEAPVSLESNRSEGYFLDRPFENARTASSDARFLYGGSNESDNSGSLSHVSIRHTGQALFSTNFSGLTLAGVGKETSITDIEIVGAMGDGLHLIGGTAALEKRNALEVRKNGIVTDNAYAGTIRNTIIISPKETALDLNGPKGLYEGKGHTIINGLVFLNEGAGYDDDENTDAIVSEIYFTGFTNKTSNFNDYHENGSFRASNFQMDNPIH